MAPDTSDACSYTPKSGDKEENSYWLGVCDDLSLCDPNPLAGGKFKVQGLPIEKPIEKPPEKPPPLTIENLKEVLEGAKESFQETVIKPVQETVKTIRENPKVKTVVENPVVDTTVKTTVGVGVGTAVTTGIISLMPFASRIFDFILLPQRILQLLGIAFFRKKAKPWGVVYDSFTKQPLDPVYVVLKDKEGKEVDSKITDLNGRFGFLVPPGEYYLEINKTHYKFPSEKVKGIRDELYENLYHGELIEVTDPTLISINVPMDPLDFDWNEVAKRKIIKFNYRWELVKRWAPATIFYLGFLLTLIFFVLKSSFFNFAMFLIYILLFILRKIGFKEKHWGLVLDKKKKKPWPFSILTIFYEKSLNPIKQTACDVIGRYYALVEPGRYDVAVERKVKDEYQFTGKYPGLKAKKGIINKDLLIEVEETPV